MKILFMSHYSFLYGSNRSLESLIMYFRKQNIQVEVLLPSKGVFYKQLQENQIKVYAFRFFYEVLYVKWKLKYLSLPILWLYDLLAFPFLLYKISRINPDIIYTNSSVDTFSIWIAKILRKKHVVHIREFMFEDFGAHFLFGRKMKKWYLQKSDKIICVSQAVAHTVMGELPPNAKVIYNGVKQPKISKDISTFPDNLRLGVVGNLDISKQQDMAIKLMVNITKKYPNIKLHIIGDKNGPYKNYLYKLVNDLQLNDSVIFDGFIKEIDKIYENLDVLLMCSRSEAFGRVTVEAMLRNIPVIGFDSGGTSELIENEVTGFKYKDSKDIIKALDILINNPEKSVQIIENAKSKACNLYSENTYTTSVYNFVISK